MPVVETEALVLRTYNLAEADKIVVCLSRSTGLIRGVAKGCRRLKNKFGAAFEPFTLVNLSYYQKENQELVSLRQAEIIKSCFDLSSNPVILSGLAYMGDLILEFSPPNQANDNLFRMVRACLEAISEGPQDLQAVLRYFEVWLLRLEGFLSDVKRCADCHRLFTDGENVFLETDDSFRCRTCASVGAHSLTKKVHSQLLLSLKLHPENFARESRDSSPKADRELAQLTQRMIGRVLERELRTRPSYIPVPLGTDTEDVRY
jgi:DNA repair protein RecO (recombination protein O)